MMTVIPLTSSPAQRFAIALEGQTVTMFLRYQSLIDAWVLAIEREGVMIASGLRLVMGTDLLRAFNFGLGGIFLFAAEEPGVHPGRDDLETRVQMIHVTEAEIAAIST